jgi:hypothetical protein
LLTVWRLVVRRLSWRGLLAVLLLARGRLLAIRRLLLILTVARLRRGSAIWRLLLMRRLSWLLLLRRLAVVLLLWRLLAVGRLPLLRGSSRRWVASPSGRLTLLVAVGLLLVRRLLITRLLLLLLVWRLLVASARRGRARRARRRRAARVCRLAAAVVRLL